MRAELEIKLFRDDQKETLAELARKYRNFRAHVERMQGYGHLPQTKIEWVIRGLVGKIAGPVVNPDPNQFWLPFPTPPPPKDPFNPDEVFRITIYGGPERA